METSNLNLLTYVLCCRLYPLNAMYPLDNNGGKDFYYTGIARPDDYRMGEEIKTLLSDKLIDAKIYDSAGEAMAASKQLTQFYNVRALPVPKKPFFVAILKGERK